MALIVLVLGILLAGAGGALIGFGIPIKELNLGTTLILAGTTALVGGLLMIGLSAAVAELRRIANGLKARPAARPTRSAEPTATPAEMAAREPPALELPATEVRPPESRPVPAPAVDVSASAIERLRSSIPRPERNVPVAEEVPLSPNGGQPQHAQHAEPSAETPAGAAAAVETVREPRLDFLFRQRSTVRAASQPESFDALWPKRNGREPQVDAKAEQRSEPRTETKVEETRAPAPAATSSMAPTAVEVRPQVEPTTTTASPDEVQRSVAILKSGVVDGMAYTLYADGSIEAQLPQGTVRFGSIAELRAHIENNS